MGGLFERLKGSKELIYRAVFIVLMLVIFLPIIATTTSDERRPDWSLLFWFSFALILTTQVSMEPIEFFTGAGASFIEVARYYLTGTEYASAETKNIEMQKNHENVGFWRLMPSAFITWIFAKSIRNASVLAASYGMLGAVAYAGWYLSFFSASIVIYLLRTRHNSTSLPRSIQYCYGDLAQCLFCLGLLYRLNNEVWSNSVIVAGFYGETYSAQWWGAIIFSTLVPAVYVFIGGMRSSLISDVIQAGLAFLFLFIILGQIGADENFDINKQPEGGYAEGGWELLAVAVIQGLYSYPFHDPVLTDRCYLSTPKTMLLSFTVGGFVSMLFIILFGIIGVYGKQVAGSGEPQAVGGALGATAYTLVNFVFMTSSMSTLDSTFTSTSKIFGLDIGGWFKQLNSENRGDKIGPLSLNDVKYMNKKHVLVGRIAIIFMAIIGTLPLLADAEALNATLVSGTTVMGLGPPIYLLIFWKWRGGEKNEFGWYRSPLTFTFSFITGVVYGALYQANGQDAIGEFDDNLTWGEKFGVGSYAVLLGTNVWGHICCTLAALLGFILDQYALQSGSPLTKPEIDDQDGYSEGNKQDVDGDTEGDDQGRTELVEKEIITTADV
eukprot:CAMPEP_0201581786 /NCGR_PEP_ID=MMETSP0190_2-20130828/75304_1 /ASSEMBLY_ACC=CAM_ASM_000263 /TAXON_ID=37353 /ORGANISM="Rosalina sp." /LENGTH=608 /DNA_ID=CAMNT_0048020453 /DNA_START=56 /DNA_END=1882 /DNA_ORIENTATION=+